MPRYWFRLDDVLPLAEHALGCMHNGISRAEVLAGANTGPALIFTNTRDGAHLRSNGIPSWYYNDGVEYRAHAVTWRHTPTGRSGHVHLRDYQHAFLPLVAPVTHLLRTARVTGRTWFSVHIDSRDQHLITPYALRTSEYHDQPLPAGTRWKKATVSCADVADIGYPALIPVDYTDMRGDALPRFDQTTAARIVSDLDELRTSPSVDAMPGEYPILRRDGDELIVMEEQADRGTWTYRQIDRIRPDRDGYIALGAYQWPWHTVVPPSRLPAWMRRWTTLTGRPLQL